MSAGAGLLCLSGGDLLGFDQGADGAAVDEVAGLLHSPALAAGEDGVKSHAARPTTSVIAFGLTSSALQSAAMKRVPGRCLPLVTRE